MEEIKSKPNNLMINIININQSPAELRHHTLFLLIILNTLIPLDD